MITRKYLVATLSNQSNTIRLPATIFKGLLLGLILPLDFPSAKSTFACILIWFGFFASHTNMVWCFLTACAEIVRATGAANSKLSHVISSLFWNDLASLVLLFVIRFWGLKHNYTWAITADHPWVEFDSLLHLQTFNCVDFFARHHFFDLLKRNRSSALKTLRILKSNFLVAAFQLLRSCESFYGILFEARDVELVETICLDKHVNQTFLFILGGYLIFAIGTVLSVLIKLFFFKHIYIIIVWFTFVD